MRQKDKNNLDANNFLNIL